MLNSLDKEVSYISTTILGLNGLL